MSFLAALTARFRASVRYKLVFLVLLPLVVVLPMLIALVIHWGNASYDRLLVFKVNSDLKAAQQYFEQVLRGVGAEVASLANSNRLALALGRREPGPLSQFLVQARGEARLDFLNFLDLNGRLVAAGNEQTRSAAGRGDSALTWPVVQAALEGNSRTAIDIYSEEQLALLDLQLREQASIQLLPAPDAAPTDRKYETRGMMVHSAAPVFNADNKLVGILEGGLLLNRNLGFVDTINNIVYREGALPLGSHGTVTLFLDDVRIATNVRLFQGERAIGTRVSQEVRERVLGRGESWAASAFVVNDWYVSAYEPIVDSLGRRVGMLYVGYLEAPFQHVKHTGLAAIVLLFIVISLVSGVVSLRWAREIFRPLERMNQTISAVEAGNSAARVGRLESVDEIGQLAQHLDELLATLERRNAELKSYADELDMKVAERTAQLEAANRSLREAQQQLIMSEKLAAIGELTAGVAHEINNPIAVIQGNLDVVREVLGPAAEPVMREIRLIDEQVDRIRSIVTRLLQFARPAEFAGYVEQVDVNGVIGDCLVLVRHELKKGVVEVRQDLSARLPVAINRNELQQVIINLLVNAIHAMPGGGKLSLETWDWDGRGVAIRIRDTGTGIRAEDLSRVFDPFFTTKRQGGTGLGLSISYALVERYGGRITVESEYGKGSAFTVWLLSEPRYSGEQAVEAQALEP